MVSDIITSRAVTPDQLTPYVRAVAGMECRMLADMPFYMDGDNGILVAYGLPGIDINLEAVVDAVLAKGNLRQITVLAAQKPPQAPENAICKNDMYWALNLPLESRSQKLRNMLKRAAREITIDIQSGPSAWTPEHTAIVEAFCARKKNSLDDGSIYIFNQMKNYLVQAPKVLLFSGRRENGALAAFAVGDFSAFATAFYMFAFRDAEAPPGAADLLLNAIIAEAEKNGMARVNLGLGIDSGVEFFKKKWGAKPWLPYVETTWQVRKKGFLSRLFG